MKKAKVKTSQKALILTHDALSNSLTFLLHQTPLDSEVKRHCRLGLKVFGIILTDLSYNTGTHLLIEKEFDPFFTRFPAKFYNEKRENRRWICAYSVAKNIESCIKANAIVSPVEERGENILV